MTGTAAEASHLRTEWREEPLGIDEPQPRLSWWVKDDRPGARQTAYRVRAATTASLLTTAPDLWDSGRVDSDRQTEVAYSGAPLTSRVRAVWDVTLWDPDGCEGSPSTPSTFEMGLLARHDWSASWIGTGLESPGQDPLRHAPPAPVLSKKLILEAPVRTARLYVTALGLYDVALNGSPVGDQWFRPGWTDYRSRVQYQTYDVGAALLTGSNVIEVTLGDGWYSGRIGLINPATVYGDSPCLLLQLEVEHEDGTRTVLTSDDSWTWSPGPVTRQDLLDGEHYDARLEGFSSDVSPALVVGWPDAALVAQCDDGVRVVAELSPVGDPQAVHGGANRAAFIFDLGQNFAGVPRLQVQGPAGAQVRLRYAEMLDAVGSMYTDNLRSALNTDIYTLRGDPDGETWTPRFTFHGFRYVEVSHDASVVLRPFDQQTITGVALSSLTAVTGTFRCSDERLNQLQSNTQWSQWSNFLEVPSDCPQRDERLGWTGDAQVFAPTAAFNMDVAAFFTKWSRDLDDAQLPDGQIPSVVPSVIDPGDGGPGWSDARVLCGWAMYQAYGDRRTLERHYEPMVRWLDWQASTAKDGVRCWPECGYFEGYSDWLSLDADWQGVFSATPKDFIGTAYFAATSGVMTQIAELLGHSDDALRFAGYRSSAVEAFNANWVTAEGVVVQTQTAQLMALAWDLLPEPSRAGVLTRLLELLEERDWHLSTGFLGTPLLCPVLSRFGRTDVAYRVLLNDGYPGWLFPVRNGATTIWERWNGWTPEYGFGDKGMNSFNHYAYGAIGQWMYENIGGLAIDPHTPAYARVRIAPQPDGRLQWAEAELATVRGPVRTRWNLSGETFTLQVGLAPNTTAEVTLPDGTVHEVAAGQHEFSCDFAPAESGGHRALDAPHLGLGPQGRMALGVT